MRRIFISHPYASNPEENFKRAEEICKEILRHGGLPISPLHLFSFTNDDHRTDILAFCCKLIKQCDEAWFYGDSEGCEVEYETAVNNNIPVTCFGEGERLSLRMSKGASRSQVTTA